MATKIRGITIELSADATGVLDSLKEVNSEITSTSRQLKDVDNLLKLDPTNTELLEQKTKLLQDQIANTTTKLDELKKAEEDMTANGVDENSEQYQALQREIIATEQQLATLQKTAGSGSATLMKISTVTGEWGDKMEKAGKKLSVLSAGIVALGAGAMKAFEDYDEGADIIIKKTGATGEAAAELEQNYKNVAQNIVGDFEDIGASIGEVSTRFGLTGDDLEDLSTEFLKFAEINDTDVSGSVDSVQKALAAFGLDADDAKRLLDRLTVVSQNTGISVDDLSAGLVKNGAAFAEMGLNIDQASIFMGQMETSGADADTVMQGLRKALKNATEDGIPLNDALSDLQDTILNGKDGVDGLTLAYDLFGKSGDQIYEAVKNGTLDFANLAVAVDDVSGAVDDTYAATLDGSDQMALAWQNMQIALADLGAVIGEVLAPIMEKITTAIQGVVEWFDNLDEGTKETIVTIGLIVAAIGPLLLVGGKVLNGISSITGALSKIGTSSFGPIGLVIAAVGVAVGAFAAWAGAVHDAYLETSPYTDALDSIKTKNDELSTAIDSTKGNYEDQITEAENSAAAAEALYGKLQDLMAGYDGSAEAGLQIQGVIDEINKLLPDMGLQWDSATNSLNLNTAEIYNQISAMKAQAQAAAAQEFYTESLKQQYEAQQNLTAAQDVLKDMMEQFGLTAEDVLGVMNGNTEAIDNVGLKMLDAGVGAGELGAAMEQLVGANTGLVDAMANVNKANENVTYSEQQWTQALADAAVASGASTQAIKDLYLQTFGEEMPQILQDAIDDAQEAGVKIPQNIVDGLMNGTISVDDAAQQITDAMNKAAEAEAQGQETGESYVDGVESGVDGGTKVITSSAEDATSGLDQSENAYDYGSDTGSSYNQGLSDQSTVITDTAGEIADDVTGEFDDVPDEMYGSGTAAGQQLDSGFGSNSGSISTTADSIWNIWYQAFGVLLPSSAWSWGYTAMTKFGNGIEGYTLLDSKVQTIIDNLKTKLLTWAQTLEATGYIAMSWFGTGLSSYSQNLYAKMQSIASSVASYANASNYMYNAGWNTGIGFNNGLVAAAGYIYSTAATIANSVVSTISSALAIRSPSRVMMGLGEYTGEGFQIGLEDSAEGIYATIDQIADNVSGMQLPEFDSTGFSAMNAETMQRSQAAQLAQAQGTDMNAMMNLLTKYLPYLAERGSVVLDSGALVGEIAPDLNDALGVMNARAARG